MDIPGEIRTAIEESVTSGLARELGTRGLLLTPERSAAAETWAADDGDRLLTSTIHHCYPLSQYDTQVVTLEFESEVEASRVRSALAFGAATAGLLMSPPGRQRHAGSIELLSAVFNLGIGLLDGLCDGGGDSGLGLLNLIDHANVADAARQPRPRGWLRVALPPEWESDPTVVFTADMVETFFAMLHATYPGDSSLDLRGRVGDQLAKALASERSSLLASFTDASPAQLTQYSFATSVVPFEIVGTLAHGGGPLTAAHFLGVAMWRIDDLVDLCDDARTGALNAVLLDALGSDSPGLGGLLVSDHIALAAVEAAENLRHGVDLAEGRDGDRHPDVFLSFIARYAGIGPRES